VDPPLPCSQVRIGLPESQQRLWDGALEALALLASLSWELTIAARGEYGTAGSMPSVSEYVFQCYNELLQRTSLQMCQGVGVPPRRRPPPKSSSACFEAQPLEATV
jgi:hypothetical protein